MRLRAHGTRPLRKSFTEDKQSARALFTRDRLSGAELPLCAYVFFFCVFLFYFPGGMQSGRRVSMGVTLQRHATAWMFGVEASLATRLPRRMHFANHSERTGRTLP